MLLLNDSRRDYIRKVVREYLSGNYAPILMTYSETVQTVRVPNSFVGKQTEEKRAELRIPLVQVLTAQVRGKGGYLSDLVSLEPT